MNHSTRCNLDEITLPANGKLLARDMGIKEDYAPQVILFAVRIQSGPFFRRHIIVPKVGKLCDKFPVVDGISRVAYLFQRA